jgi:hypothetical protein
MTDRMRKEHTMKRIAIVVGIAAALATPTVAAAGNSVQVQPQIVQAQIVKPHIVEAQIHRAQIAKGQRLKPNRLSLLRTSFR